MSMITTRGRIQVDRMQMWLSGVSMRGHFIYRQFHMWFTTFTPKCLIVLIIELSTNKKSTAHIGRTIATIAQQPASILAQAHAIQVEPIVGFGRAY